MNVAILQTEGGGEWREHLTRNILQEGQSKIDTHESGGVRREMPTVNMDRRVVHFFLIKKPSYFLIK